jgi:hypothetical protein
MPTIVNVSFWRTK